MTVDEATELLQSMTASDVDPVLSDDEIDRLVASSQRADLFGIPPTDSQWTPTYDLASAAAKGWLLKMGKASNRVDFIIERSGVTRSQFIKHCQMMANEYRRQVGQSVRVAPYGTPMHPRLPA